MSRKDCGLTDNFTASATSENFNSRRDIQVATRGNKPLVRNNGSEAVH